MVPRNLPKTPQIRPEERRRPPRGPQEHPRGAQDGSLAPEKPPRDPQGHPRGAQKAPKRPPRTPKRGPREPQDALKTIFGSKTPIFQKSSSRRSEIMVFEGKRVRLGGQNRPQEGRKGVQTRLRRRYEQRRCQESRKKLRRSPKVTIHWPCQYIMSILGRARGGVLALACGMRGACVPPNFPLPLAFLPI